MVVRADTRAVRGSPATAAVPCDSPFSLGGRPVSWRKTRSSVGPRRPISLTPIPANAAPRRLPRQGPGSPAVPASSAGRAGHPAPAGRSRCEAARPWPRHAAERRPARPRGCDRRRDPSARCRSRRYAAVIDDSDLVRELVRFFEVLRRQQNRRPLAAQVADDVPDLVAAPGSSPVVGSSRKSTRGCVSMLERGRAAAAYRPSMSLRSCRRIDELEAVEQLRSTVSCFLRGSRNRRPNISRFSRPVEQLVDRCELTRRASCPRTFDGSAATSRPSSSASPASGRSKVGRMRTRVVLPAPFRPRRPNTIPSGTSRSTPANAVVEPNRFTRPLTRTAGGVTRRSCGFVLRREEIAHREPPVRAPGCASITPPSTGSALRRSSRAFRSASGARLRDP